MNCCLKNCYNESFTSDGFCEKHKFYTSKDFDYIRDHIKMYLNNFTKLTTSSKKIELVLRLFNYIKYKKEFLRFYPKFYDCVLQKSNELLFEIEIYGSSKDKLKFESLVEIIKEINTMT